METESKNITARRLNALVKVDFEQFHAELNASVALTNELKEDFRKAMVSLTESGAAAFDRRNVVRCFGSLIEGLTSSMRFAAIAICKQFDEPLNPFLQEKTGERNLGNHQRIYSIYRLLADFLPKSPLARIPDRRWDELRFALEIRNRVVHPTTLVELEVSNGEVQLITQTGLNFYNDFRQFVQWFSEKEQKMLWDLPGNRRRYLKKTGRNESCPLRQRPQIQELLRAGTGVIRLSLPDPGDSQTYPFIFRRVSL